MTTQLPKDPLIEMNEFLKSKDSRENLHDTSYAVDSMHKKETIDNFLDTISCGLEEMSGEEVFECFFKAVQSQYEYTKKEHSNTKQLMHLLMELK